MSAMPVAGIEPDEAGGVAAPLDLLIQAMTRGEEDALARFYDRTRRQVYGLVKRILKDAALADEVTLDIYLQVWRTAARYRPERGSPLAWLITLARSRAIDRLRTLTLERQQLLEPWSDEHDVPASDPLPDEGAAAAERARQVQQALAQLLPEHRQVVTLAYFEGLSHGEIADRLAMPLGTVKTRIRVGMLRLQALLSPWFSENV